MGHDIDIRKCPTPATEDCKKNACRHSEADSTYISYNFSKFDEYWHISDLQGHRGKTGLKKLRYADKRLAYEGVEARILEGQNGWTDTKNVFRYHVQRFIALCEKYPECRFYSDGCLRIRGESDTDSVVEGEESCEEDDVCDENPEYEYHYRHPHKGNVCVNSFEKAAEAYAMAVLEGSRLADSWFQVLRQFKEHGKVKEGVPGLLAVVKWNNL